MSINFFKTFNRSHFLRFAILFIECKPTLTSLIIDNANKKLPNANEIKAIVKCIEHESNKHSRLQATKYPIGLFVLNGKLSYERVRSLYCVQRKNNNSKFHSTYYDGNGKSKASFPKSVAKYVKKLTKNFGISTDGSTIFVVIKLITLHHFSICLLVLLYIAIDFGYCFPKN